MRGISAVATCVIAAIAPYACFPDPDPPVQGAGSATISAVGGPFFPGPVTTTTVGGTTAGGTSAGGHLGTLLGGFDADTVLETAGSGGAAGGAGRGGAPADPSEPAIPEGALLAAGWDDNANFEWFTRREAPSESDPEALPQLDAMQVSDAHELAQSIQPEHAFLDIALVLDTTGSMGDELAYLEREVGNLWHQVQRTYPESEQRWALIAYRDEGDNYVHVPFDFTADVDEYLGVLEELVAEGGGDEPEASDQALRDLQALSWRSDPATARLAFWFSDAPHHRERSEEFANALSDAKDLGVKLYPVASENASALTVHSMRTAAQVTGGRYLFLLNGDPAASPGALPCYYVTELNSLLLRVVRIEMDGRYYAPTLETLLGVNGALTHGRCESELGPIAAF